MSRELVPLLEQGDTGDGYELRTTGPAGQVWRLCISLGLPKADASLWGRSVWATGPHAPGEGRWQTIGDAIEWHSITGRFRGYRLGRGADSPGDRPRVAELSLTLDNVDGALNPWTTTPATGLDTHPPYYGTGTLVRVSWIYDGNAELEDRQVFHQFTGEVETWVPRISELYADAWVEITAVDLAARLASVNEPELDAGVGAGDTLAARLERLLDAADYPGGLSADAVTRGNTMQPTTMAANRLGELYLTADSDGVHVLCGRDGLLTTRFAVVNAFGNGGPSVPVAGPTFVLGGTTNVTPTTEMSAAGYDHEVPFDPRSLELSPDRTTVVNRVSLAAAGGTAVTAEDGSSRSWYGSAPFSRSDLICQSATFPERLAGYMVAAYAWARPIATVTVHAAAGNEHLGLLCIATHDLFHRLDLWLRDQSGARVIVPAWIASLEQQCEVVSSDAAGGAAVVNLTCTYTLVSDSIAAGTRAGYVTA